MELMEGAGSDLHLLHGMVPELQKGDILGHEVRLLSRLGLVELMLLLQFVGIVESVGPEVIKVKVGDRVVACCRSECSSPLERFYPLRVLSQPRLRQILHVPEEALAGVPQVQLVLAHERDVRQPHLFVPLSLASLRS